MSAEATLRTIARLAADGIASKGKWVGHAKAIEALTEIGRLATEEADRLKLFGMDALP